jgi:hypothetical protein
MRKLLIPYSENNFFINIMRCAILFTDIKSSSHLWKTYKGKMGKALDRHNSQISRAAKKNKGFIVKTIGDAYMIAFGNLANAIYFALDMCNMPPVKLSKEHSIQIRMGICYGSVQKKNVIVQGKKLVDYFGQAVNIASRMESKVSGVGGFAFCIEGEKKANKDAVKLLEDLKIKYKLDFFTYDNCRNVTRSERILNSQQQIPKCLDANILKGVGEILAYECSPNG